MLKEKRIKNLILLQLFQLPFLKLVNHLLRTTMRRLIPKRKLMRKWWLKLRAATKRSSSIILFLWLVNIYFVCFGIVLTRVTWFFHICNSHIQERKSDIFVVMETRSDPSNLKRAFSRVGFNGFYFSESRGFLYGIAMGWKDDKLQVHILKRHFQFLHSRIIIEDGKT